jgi:hypothetical protein
MPPKYRFVLKRVQDFSFLGFVGVVLFLFINWKISALLLPISIAAGIFVSKKALTYIG